VLIVLERLKSVSPVYNISLSMRDLDHCRLRTCVGSMYLSLSLDGGLELVSLCDWQLSQQRGYLGHFRGAYAHYELRYCIASIAGGIWEHKLLLLIR